MWDPQQARFFYVMDDVISATDNRLAFGFSKGPSPSTAADFCKYTFPYGAEFPDYPKLGDTQHFITIGVNTFAPGFVGADVAWVSKPPTGTITTCPSAATFNSGVEFSLEDAGTSAVFTPVAVNQTDTSATGYVVARSGPLPATFLSLHKVTRDPGTGDAIVQNPGQNVTVPSYTFPADAPQPGTAKVLDTLDGRPTQAVSGIDPRFGASGVNSIWTQHTIAGPGGRSVVRWYEINPIPRTLFQSGTIQSPSLFVFNGAISPDRGVMGATKVGGSNMVTGLSTSSSTVNPGIRMVSKVGAAAQSGMVVVKNSPGDYVGFDCAGADNDCRWGDYSGATPDPNPPAGQTQVWLTNQWASGGTSTAITNWRTQNWVARP